MRGVCAFRATVGAVVVPTMLGFVVVAPDLMSTVLGARWHAAIPVARILACVTLFQGLTSTAQRTLLASGRANVVFRNSLLRTGLAIVGFVAGLRWGITGVAAGYAVLSIPAQTYLIVVVSRQLEIGAVKFIGFVSGVLQAAVVMAAACALLQMALALTALPTPLRLVLVVCAGAAVYLPALRWRCPEVLSEIRRRQDRAGSNLARTAA